MPLVTITVRTGKSSAFKSAILDGVHRALIASGVPEKDRFQRVLELGPDDFRFDPEYPDLTVRRDEDFVAPGNRARPAGARHLDFPAHVLVGAPLAGKRRRSWQPQKLTVEPTQPAIRPESQTRSQGSKPCETRGDRDLDG